MELNARLTNISLGSDSEHRSQILCIRATFLKLNPGGAGYHGGKWRWLSSLVGAGAEGLMISTLVTEKTSSSAVLVVVVMGMGVGFLGFRPCFLCPESPMTMSRLSRNLLRAFGGFVNSEGTVTNHWIFFFSKHKKLIQTFFTQFYENTISVSAK